MIKFVGNFFVVSVVCLLSACSLEDLAETCESVFACPADNSTAQLCCTFDSCRYVTGTKTFSCSGTDCITGTQTLTDFCLGTTASKSEIELANMLGLEKVENMMLKKSIDDMYRDLGVEASQE